METKHPRVKILRSSDGRVIGAYPLKEPYVMPSKYPCEDIFLRGSVASASDCTGITVTIPQTDLEAESLMDIRDIPVTSADGDAIIPD